MCNIENTINKRLLDTSRLTRALATIRTVDNIRPIPNADAIELAIVGGWQCVVKKDTFKVGDLGVYFEIDSFLKIEPRYEFLRKSSYKKLEELAGKRCEGFKLKTIKMRGELSQGLLMPLSEFPELTDKTPGLDVTYLLDVELYEPPEGTAVISGNAKGKFPAFIRKTNQERIQNAQWYLDQYKDVSYEVTEKLDGSSTTAYLKDGVFGVCSHNLEIKLEEEDNSFIKIALDYGLEDRLRSIGRNLAFQGELVGEGIQKNPLKVPGKQFFLFDVWDIDKNRYLTADERHQLSFVSDLHIPVVAQGFLRDIAIEVKDLLKFADGISLLNNKVAREGLVFKPCSDINAPTFKVVSNAYLLKNER
jgi:RNA ligase (TIGR02306 family)